jgi:hypothetical protein
VDAHLAKIEEEILEIRQQLITIEVRLDRCVTHDDLFGSGNSLQREFEIGVARFKRWVVGTALGIFAVGTMAISLALKFAMPEVAPTPIAQPAQVVILLPPYPSPTPAPR